MSSARRSVSSSYYTSSSRTGDSVPPAYSGNSPRPAWGADRQARSHSPEADTRTFFNNVEETDRERSGSRTSRTVNEQHDMEIDQDEGGTDTTDLKHTIQLIQTLDGMKKLLSRSSAEIKVLKDVASGKHQDNATTVHLKQQIEDLKMKNQMLEAKVNSSPRETLDVDRIKKLEDQAKKLSESNVLYKSRYEEQSRLYKIECDKVEELKATVEENKVDLNKMSTEWMSMNSHLSKLQGQFEAMKKEKDNLEKELSQTKTRLSRLMGDKLADNNPNLADLSDSNRPTKIAEQFSELYDNEWTDAFEVFLKEERYEKRAIEELLKLLMDVKRHCDKISKEEQRKLYDAVAVTGIKKVDETVKKQIKEFRRFTVESTIPGVLEKFVAGARIPYARLLRDEHVLAFVKGCVKVCWLMSVQDPPLTFGVTPRYLDAFDTNVYKAYTKTGKQIDFVVWPTLLLHEDGPLLSKGVAQGYAVLDSTGDERRKGVNIMTSTMRGTFSTDREPKQQSIDHHDRRPDGSDQQYTGGFGNSVLGGLGQNTDDTNSNYGVQSVVSSNCEKYNLSMSDRGQAKDYLNKNLNQAGSQSRMVQKPPNEVWASFKSLIHVYGYGIDDHYVKQFCGSDYEKCVEYYNYMHSSNESYA